MNSECARYPTSGGVRRRLSAGGDGTVLSDIAVVSRPESKACLVNPVGEVSHSMRCGGPGPQRESLAWEVRGVWVGPLRISVAKRTSGSSRAVLHEQCRSLKGI